MHKWLMAAAGIIPLILLLVYVIKGPPLQHEIATPAPAVASMPKVQTPIKTQTVKARPQAAKRALSLPAAIADDPAKVVIDSAIVKASRNDTLVTTLLDTETGETMTLEAKQPRPWLAASTDGSLWLGVGIKNGQQQVMRAGLEQGLFAVKAVTVSLRGTVDIPYATPGKPDWFAGVGLRMEW